MKNEILVSIDCITYNHEKYIRQAIESFLMQITNFKYEILIHDDASTDNTPSIIKEYEKKYPEIIKVIYQKENQYSKGKRVDLFNIQRAKGKYIAICEGDDYWTDKYKLQKQVDYMEKNTECGMCFHTVDILDDKNGKIIDEITPYKENCKALIKDIIIGGGSFIGTNSIIYRKENMLNIPDFYLNCLVGDYPLQILNSIKKYAYFMKESMSVYRVNTGNSWTDKNKDYRKQILLLINLIETLKEFNLYSNKKYQRYINLRIENIIFKMLRYDIKEKCLSGEEVKEYYKLLPFKRKVNIIFKYFYKIISK